MNFSEPFIRRPIATILLMLGLLLCGLATYRLLPVAALPNVNYPTILVTAQLPGADPQTMASTVATPLEQQMGQIPGVTQLTSTSALGVTSVTVQFELARTVDSAAVDVLAAINAASPYLPTNIPYPPTIRKVNPAETPVLLLALTSDTLPLTTIDAYAENILLPKISQIPGVGLVGIGGQQKPAIRVQVNPQALAARGIGLEDVRSVIAQANVDLPKGTLNSPRQTYTLNTNDQLLKPDAYDALIVAYRNGSPVRIRDIGKAIEAPENDLLAGWYNKQRAVILAIQRVPGANVIETVDRVKALLPQLEASLPPAIKVTIAADRTTTIRAAVADVQFTLLLTVALVVMVIFLFLRNLWATVIPAVTVPLSLIGTFAVLYVLGYSLDNLSLMALSIAVGCVVDDAVVVIENIVRHLEQGLSPMEAALKGSREIGFTIISITLSLIAVFIPLFLMGGYVGKLFQEFAVTISVSLLLSLVVSLTLTPMMCARLLKDEAHRQHGRLYRFFERGFDNLLSLYEHGLKIVLRHRFITLMVMLGTIALTGYLYVVIPKGFFPQQDTGQIVGITEAAEDISFPAMAQRQQALVDILLKDPAIDSVSNYIGPGGPTATLNQGRVFIALKPASQRDASADQVISRLRPQLARIQGITLYMQAAQDITIGARLTKTQYQYTLTDADSTELAHWSAIFVDKIKGIPGVIDVASDQANGGPMLNVTVNREVASSFGILPSTIDNALDDAFGQRIVSTIFTPLNQYHVILEVDPRFQYSPQALRDIYLNSSGGQQVPLSTLVNSDIKPAPIVVNHQGLFPSVTISFNLVPGMSLGDAVAAIQQIEKQTGKPASLATSFQGNAQAFQASLTGMPLLIGAALIVIYIILGVLYESAIHPITILSTLPSAGIGALLLLMAVHMDLSVIAMIGIILLIGIVKKNGIMLVDFALDVERREGLGPEEAIYRACIMRFRPILMTTMAALLGGVPLMLGTGTGSEIRQPLGYAIVGGLLLSQVLTLYTTPVVFLYLDRLTRRSRRAGKGEGTLQRASGHFPAE
ncbi:MAG: efflux RND transporter permease subunit [Reyranella sp.]